MKKRHVRTGKKRYVGLGRGGWSTPAYQTRLKHMRKTHKRRHK